LSNSAHKARERRRLEKGGGKRLPALTINDLPTWIEILEEQSALPPWSRNHLSTDAIRTATERVINDWCCRRRREKADAMLASLSKVRTGLIEREPAPEPDPVLSTRFSEGGHWSFRPRRQKDKGRIYEPEEIEEYLEQNAWMLPGNARSKQKNG
jgi:hypothetical protein